MGVAQNVRKVPYNIIRHISQVLLLEHTGGKQQKTSLLGGQEGQMDDDYSTNEVNTSTYTLENRAPPKLIGRYLKLFPLGHHPYHRQTEYPGRWPKAYNPYTAQELVDHLDPDTDVWIASKALRDRRGPFTYFLMLDFDNKGDVPAEERLTRVTKEFGIEPQVWTSPGGGYHAYWYFDGPTRLVNLMQGSGSHTQGLVPDLITQALGRTGGPGIVEVFPQQGQVMRWPLGRRQHLVNTENWSTTILTPEEKIAAAEEYRETTPLLSYQYLKKLKRDKPTITVLPYTPSDQRLDQDEVVRLFKEGLNRRGTRNNSTYLVAQAMVTQPELLEPFGFDTEGDVVEQMRVWMLKHNGSPKGWPIWIQTIRGYGRRPKGSSRVLRVLPKTSSTG